VGRGVVPPVAGHPVVEVRRHVAARGIVLPSDPKLVFGVLTRAAGFVGYVVDMTVGNRLSGSGSALWAEVLAVARTGGLVRFELDAQDVGGYFWAKHGFDLSFPKRDAVTLVAHMASRGKLLARAGAPVPGELREWLAHPDAASWVAKNGVRALLNHLPTSPVPRLDDDGAPMPGRTSPMAAALLVGSRWTGHQTL
jgi:hypothetical protein